MRFFWNSFLSFFVIVMMTYPALANDKQLSEMTLEELLDIKVYSATKRSTRAHNVSAMVTVISGDDLAKYGSQNLAEALNYVSGVVVRRAPGDFPEYQISIRGNSSDFMNVRTLFLIDGVPIRNANAGFDPGWIPVSIIKRVEIVKGANSNLWGANAFGGTINVITRSGGDFGSETGGEVKAGYQSRYDHAGKNQIGGEDFSGTVGKNSSNVDYVASAQYSRTGDSQSYSGHRYLDVFGKTGYKPNENLVLSLKTFVSADENQIGVENASEPIHNHAMHVAASADQKIGDNSELKFTAFMNSFTHHLNYDDEIDVYENKASTLGGGIQYSTLIEAEHHIIFGSDIFAEEGFLDTNERDFSTFPPVINEAGWDKKYQSTWSSYFQYEYQGWEKLRPLFGLRYDNNSLYGNAVSPRLAASYLLNDNNNLFASIGRAFRAPLFNETHLRGFGKVGNEDLHPEWILSYEIGLKSVYKNSQYSIALFKQDITDKIDLKFINPDDPNSLQMYENTGNPSIVGVELDGAYSVRPGFRIFYNVMLLETDDSDGELIERTVERKFVLGTDWTVETWTLGLIALHESEVYFFNTNPAVDDDSKNRVHIPQQTTGNIYLKKAFAPSTIATLYLNNVTNLKYKQRFSSWSIEDAFLMPGRTIGFNIGHRF